MHRRKYCDEKWCDKNQSLHAISKRAPLTLKRDVFQIQAICYTLHVYVCWQEIGSHITYHKYTQTSNSSPL